MGVHPDAWKTARGVTIPKPGTEKLTPGEFHEEAGGPKGHHGPEGILGRRGVGLTERLWQRSFLRKKEKPDEFRSAEHRRLQGEIEVKPKGVAYRVARDWKDTKNSIRTDGSRLENGKVGAAAVWWAAERVEPPRIGPVTGRTYTPGRRETIWMGMWCHLGMNKEVFDAELYALYQAVKIFNERNEQDQSYIVLSDSAAAIEHARSGEMGLGQRLAVAIIEVCSRLTSRGNTLTLRWVPSHLEIEGNEIADDLAKGVAEDPGDPVPRACLCETGFAYINGRVTEARSAGVSSWIADHVNRWWYGRDERQSSHPLFVNCEAWKPQT